MKNILLIIITIFLNITFSYSQDILLTVNNEKFTKDEFLRIYKKNNISNNKKSIDKYLNLYINLKLKVAEAKSLGLDTTTAFRNELSYYRSKVSMNYIFKKELFEKLVKEAYDRLKTEIRVKHIFINVDKYALPQDTLRAYYKALKIRRRLIKKESFAKVAKETSDDPMAKTNGGDLWYISAFESPYEFENYIYNTYSDSYSYPIRTDYGYHIIKIFDKRKAFGRIKVSHIMISLSDNSDKTNSVAEKRINEIYGKLRKNEDFAKLAEKHSEDKGTAKNGGILPWLTKGKIVKEFELNAYKLKKIGSISKPFKTKFGWHIIKLINKKGILPFNKVEKRLKNEVERSPRSEKHKKYVIEKLKKQFKYSQFSVGLDEFYFIIDSTIFKKKWILEKSNNIKEPMFKLNNKIYKQNDFAKYLFENQKIESRIPINTYVNKKYSEYVNSLVVDTEEKMLENKNIEFKYLMNEYYDGILLFELTDKLIWSKALNDSIAQKKYYRKNKEKYIGKWKIDASVFSYTKEKEFEKAIKLLKKRDRKDYSDEYIVSKVSKSDNESFKLVEKSIFIENKDTLLNPVFNKIKKKEIDKFRKIIELKENKLIVYMYKLIEPSILEFNSVRARVIVDYQKHLEINWIKGLKRKYNVRINKYVLKKMK